MLEYPDLSQPIKLDASTTEANRLKVESTPMALLELVSSDGTERIAISAEQFARAIKGDAAEVMANAEALTFPQQPESAPEQPKRRGRRPRDESTAAAPRGDKIDYTSPDHFGQIHRGRLNDEEIRLVKDNPEQASRNREVQGHPPIDWDDEKERSRYGLTDDDVVGIKAQLAS